MMPALLAVLLTTAVPRLAAAAVVDPQTGFITAPAGVPAFNAQEWNQAYRLAVQGVPASHSQQVTASLRYPHSLMPDLQLPHNCSNTGFDTTPASSVALGACFVRHSASGATADFWFKVPGLALVAGNCYAYALGFFRGGYALPGTKSSASADMQQMVTCPAVHAALVSDGGEPVSRRTALTTQPDSGHFIAVLARPESCIRGGCREADFHALRKDASGTWSWKHPGMAATNRDLFGRLVSDPEAAALQGAYQLCGYYRVRPQEMLHADRGSLKQPGPLALGHALDAFKAMPGVRISVERSLPYNAATDAAVMGAASRQMVADDAAWEATRGSEQYEAWRTREKQALGLLPRGMVSERAHSSAGTPAPAADGARRLLDRGSGRRGLRL